MQSCQFMLRRYNHAYEQVRYFTPFVDTSLGFYSTGSTEECGVNLLNAPTKAVGTVRKTEYCIVDSTVCKSSIEN